MFKKRGERFAFAPLFGIINLKSIIWSKPFNFNICIINILNEL